MKSLKKMLFLGTAVLLVFALMVSGCVVKDDTETGGETGVESDTDSESDSDEASSKYSEPVEFDYMYRGDLDLAWKKGAREVITKKLKERYNIDLNAWAVDRNVYVEKLNVMFTASEPPDTFFLENLNKIAQVIQSKAVVPLTDLYETVDYLKEIDPKYYKETAIDGEYYTLTTSKNLPTWSLIYRQDWADNLGIKMPASKDELYSMLRAFTFDDPDDNGKDDTCGFAMQGSLLNADPIWHMFLPANIKDGGLYDENGVVKSVLLLKDDVKEALAWLANAYEEGVLDNEFVLLKKMDFQNKFLSGKIGMWMKGAHNILPRQSKMEKNFPDCRIMSIKTFDGAYGPVYKTFAGSPNGYFLSAKYEDIERGKLFMAYRASPEHIWDRLGKEGEAYVMDDGQFKWIDEHSELNYSPSAFIRSVFDIEPPIPEPLLEEAVGNVDGFDILPNVNTTAAKSDVFKNKITDVDKIARETMVNIIMGNQDVDDYDNAIEEMKKAGIEEILEEVNELYNK